MTLPNRNNNALPGRSFTGWSGWNAKPLHYWIQIMLVLGINGFMDRADGQCNIQSLQSTQVGRAECGGLIYQFAIGTLVTPYGSCGGRQFTPPITGSDMITASPVIPERNDISWYPNPARDEIILHAFHIHSGTYQLFAPAGHQVLSGSFYDEVVRIDVSELPPGCYFLRTQPDGQLAAITKIIKPN